MNSAARQDNEQPKRRHRPRKEGVFVTDEQLAKQLGDKKFVRAVKNWIEHVQAAEEMETEERKAVLGNVYFLASATHVKIGFSAAGVRKRLKNIRQNHYEKLSLLAVLGQVPVAVEKALHKKFAAYKEKGEWFRRTPEIEEFCRDHHLGHWRKDLMP